MEMKQADYLELITPPDWYCAQTNNNVITACASRIYYLGEAEKWAEESIEKKCKLKGYEKYSIVAKDIKVVKVKIESSHEDDGKKDIKKEEALYFLVFLKAECK